MVMNENQNSIVNWNGADIPENVKAAIEDDLLSKVKDQSSQNQNSAPEDHNPSNIIEFPEITDSNGEQPKMDDVEKALAVYEKHINDARQLVNFYTKLWLDTARELHVTIEMVNQFIAFNVNHRTEPPKEEEPSENNEEESELTSTSESVEDEKKEKEEYDEWNGIDRLTQEELDKIIPDHDHPLQQVPLELAISRIKECCGNYLIYYSSNREFKAIVSEYNHTCELKMKEEFEELKQLAENEADSEKKEKLLTAINDFYYDYHLVYLYDPPIPNDMIKRVKDLINDNNKIVYLSNRTKDILESTDCPPTIIAAMYNFESMFISPDYKDYNNCLLVWFMNQIVFSKFRDASSDDRVRYKNFMCQISRYMNKDLLPETMEIITDSLNKFVDQFKNNS